MRNKSFESIIFSDFWEIIDFENHDDIQILVSASRVLVCLLIKLLVGNFNVGTDYVLTLKNK